MERYLNRKDIKECKKIIWMRWRCGCATRGGKKSFENDRCRGCGLKEETIEHVTCCEKIIEKLGSEARK